ncbi:MAG: porin [bacterium]
MNRWAAVMIAVVMLLILSGNNAKAFDKTLEDRVAALEKQGTAELGFLKGITLSGFVDTSYTYNFNRPDSGTNTLRVFDTKDNSFELDLVELVFEKKSDEGVGFRTDLNFGHTAQILGLATRGSNDDDFEFQQAYLTYKAMGVDWMVGKFVTLHGAEVIEAPSNHNISRSFLFGYAIPFTHTGIMGTKPVGDAVDIKFGVVNGWDNTTDNNRAKTGHLGIGYHPSDLFAITVNGMYGAEKDNDTADKRKLMDVVATIKPIKNLTLLLNYDLGSEDKLAPGGKDAKWSGFSGVVRYDLTDRLGISLRGEAFNDRDGVRTGTDQDLWESTCTVSYMLRENLIVRGEYRHDDSNEEVFEDEGGNLKDSQDTLALEMTYSF